MALSKKKKQEAIDKYKAKIALEEGASDGAAAAAVADLANGLIPRMPVEPRGEEEHRENIPVFDISFSACVARSLDKKEIMSTKGAQEALLKEWAKLRSAGVRDESAAEEWGVVSAGPGEIMPWLMSA